MIAHLTSALRRFRSSQKGMVGSEYALATASTTMAMLVALQGVNGAVESVFEEVEVASIVAEQVDLVAPQFQTSQVQSASAENGYSGWNELQGDLRRFGFGMPGLDEQNAAWAGGYNVQNTSAGQYMDIPSDWDFLTDVSMTGYSLSWKQGAGQGVDKAYMSVRFYNEFGQEIGRTEAQPLAPEAGVWVSRELSGFVPMGARSVRVGMNFINTDGNFVNWGYIDDISFDLRIDEDPSGPLLSALDLSVSS